MVGIVELGWKRFNGQQLVGFLLIHDMFIWIVVDYLGDNIYNEQHVRK